LAGVTAVEVAAEEEEEDMQVGIGLGLVRCGVGREQVRIYNKNIAHVSHRMYYSLRSTDPCTYPGIAFFSLAQPCS